MAQGEQYAHFFSALKVASRKQKWPRTLLIPTESAEWPAYAVVVYKVNKNLALDTPILSHEHSR